MNNKYCPKCELTKSIEEFGKNKAKSDGLQGICKLCKKEYAKADYEENKEAYIERNRKNKDEVKKWFTEYKSTLECSKCGEDDEACLDFHHTDPSNKHEHVGILANTGSINKLKDEIAKCIILCANCHRKLHYYE